MLLSGADERPQAVLKMQFRHFSSHNVGDFAAARLDREGLFGVPKIAWVRVPGFPYIDVIYDDEAMYQRMIESCPQCADPEEGPCDRPWEKGYAMEYIQHETMPSMINGPEGWIFPAEFWRDIPAFEAQKIAILDLVLANDDRHGGNLLRQQNRLIPIDHDHGLVNAFDPTLYLSNPPGNRFLDMTYQTGFMGSPFWDDDPEGRARISQPLDERLRSWILRLDVESTLLPLEPRCGIGQIYAAKLRAAAIQAAVKAGQNLYEILSYFRTRLQEDLHSTFDLIKDRSISPEAMRKVYFEQFQQVLHRRFIL
jgi:hypothetical protein